MAPVTQHNSLYERPGLPVNARWEQEWSRRSWSVEQRQFCSGSPAALSEYVCWKEGHNCCCHPSSPEPRCRLGELEESFHLWGNGRMGALWGGEAEEAKLQSSTVWQPLVYSDPLSWHHLEPEKQAISKKMHIYCQKLQGMEAITWHPVQYCAI